MANQVKVTMTVTVDGVTAEYSTATETYGNTQSAAISAIQDVAREAAAGVSARWWRDTADGSR
jgi:hypothetical protein